MQLKMLETQSGRDDSALEVKTYEKGNVYDIGEDLGCVFLNMGVAEIINLDAEPEAEKEEPQEVQKEEAEVEEVEEVEEKKIDPVEENKMLEPEIENKSEKKKENKKSGGKKK